MVQVHNHKSNTIVLSFDRFLFLLLETMWHMLGAKSKFSTAFQPHTDCQNDVVNESSFASHVHMKSHHKLYKKAMSKIVQNNVHCKIRIDNRKLFKTFDIGDVLHACSTDPFQILKKLNCNLYVIDFGITSIFNIKDLVYYKGFDFNLSNFLINEPFHESIFERLSIPLISNILPSIINQIDKILDDEIIIT